MATPDPSNLLETFRSGLMDDNITIQLDSFNKLYKFALILDENSLKNELLKPILSYVNSISDEAALALAEQLPQLAQLIKNDLDIILNILISLIKNDEVIVRDQALISLKDVVGIMSSEQCDKVVLPLIQELIEEDYWGRKCCAVTIITIFYPKVFDETKVKLLLLLKNFAAEDMPIVRRSVANDLIGFVSDVDEIVIINDIIPTLNEFISDTDISVKEIVIDVSVAIAEHLGSVDLIMHILDFISIDESWKIRLRLSDTIHKIIPLALTKKVTNDLIKYYKKLYQDEELSVRVNTAKNTVNFLQNLLVNYQKFWNDNKFETFFVEDILPLIKNIQSDKDEVRLAFSTDLLYLSSILSTECFNQHILPIVVDYLENDSNFECKENILKSLNLLPISIDITKSLRSTPDFIKELMEQSNMFWRTRRNLLIAIDHITKHSTSDFFNENIKHFYIQLLYDRVFSVRRTAPVLLPSLIKQFGFEWAKTHLLRCVLPFAKLDKYLLRYTALFCLEELIYPSLDKNIESKEGKYLGDLKKAIEKDNEDKHKNILKRIVILLTRLGTELKRNEFSEILNAPEDEFVNPNDSFKCYSEDTLDNLQINRTKEIFAFDPSEESYLEGVLYLLVRDFFPILYGLLNDKIYNVRVKASATLRTIEKFSKEVKKEVKEAWVTEIIDNTSEEDFNAVKAEIDKELELKVELNTGYLQNLVKEQDTQLMKRQMGRKISDFSLPGIEVFDWANDSYQNTPQVQVLGDEKGLGKEQQPPEVKVEDFSQKNREEKEDCLDIGGEKDKPVGETESGMQKDEEVKKDIEELKKKEDNKEERVESEEERVIQRENVGKGTEEEGTSVLKSKSEELENREMVGGDQKEVLDLEESVPDETLKEAKENNIK